MVLIGIGMAVTIMSSWLFRAPPYPVEIIDEVRSSHQKLPDLHQQRHRDPASGGSCRVPAAGHGGGLLRQPFPKGMDLSVRSADNLAVTAATLNARPRKVLGWQTLKEAFEAAGDVHLDAREPYLIVTNKHQQRQAVALGAWLDGSGGYGPHILTIRTRQGAEKALWRICEAAGMRYRDRELHGLRHRTVDSSKIHVNHARTGKKNGTQD